MKPISFTGLVLFDADETRQGFFQFRSQDYTLNENDIPPGHVSECAVHQALVEALDKFVIMPFEKQMRDGGNPGTVVVLMVTSGRFTNFTMAKQAYREVPLVVQFIDQHRTPLHLDPEKPKTLH